MCGIIGVVQFDSPVSRGIRQKALKILFADSMLQTLSRGRDATGIFQVMTNGDWMAAKKAEKVNEWLFRKRNDTTDPQVYADFVDAWEEYPFDLRTLVGHCRAKTVGTVENKNNHPFAIQVDEKNAILGVHNGTLENHERVFAKLPPMLERQGDVDSEALFHFLFHATEQGTQPITGDAIKALGERVEGAYAVVATNTRFPNQVAVFRQTRPLDMFLIQPLNIVLLASDKKFVTNSLELYDFVRQTIAPELPVLKFEDRSLGERDYRIFDTERPFPSHHLTYQSFNEISENGEFRKLSAPVLADWRKDITPSKKPTVTPKVSKPVGAKGAGAGKEAVKATVEERDTDAAVVDVELLDAEGKALDIPDDEQKEIEAAFHEASSLGLTISYESEKEVAEALGRNDIDIDRMSPAKLATELAFIHFAIYYAMGREDGRVEVREILAKSRGSHSILEKAQNKKALAEKRIWEHRTLIQILCGLQSRHYRLDAANVATVLEAFPEPGLTPERKRDILNTAKHVLETPDTVKLVQNLQPVFEEAEKRDALEKRGPKANSRVMKAQT
jgi:hypothetical protein